MKAEPLVITKKNVRLGNLPTKAKLELKTKTQRNMPERNINTMIKREARSGKLRLLNRIMVPADVHQR